MIREKASGGWRPRLSGALLGLTALVAGAGAASASTVNLAPGFQIDSPIAALHSPTAVDFAPDGRVFVAERGGRILVYDGPADPSPTVFAAFPSRVFAGGDRGLLSIELDPDYPEEPAVYVNYTRDGLPGGPTPLYGDRCPADPHGCIVGSTVARLERDPETGVAEVEGDGLPIEAWAVHGWCQQFLGHSAGDLEFAPDGTLLASGGDGANYQEADEGQFTTESGVSPCGDPVREGGALRSQDLRTTGDPTGYNGAILRLDPATGAAAPGNPAAGGDADATRILAFGMRNPFRFEFRPGTSDLYIGDVGWGGFDEINRIPSVPPPPGGQAPNFGWPCFEGLDRNPQYDARDIPLCESLYTEPEVGLTSPIFAYGRRADLYPEDDCGEGFGAAVSGLAFYEGAAFPEAYDGALMFSDAARGCVWAAPAGAGGVPDFGEVVTLAARSTSPDVPMEFTPADVTVGPDGALYMPSVYERSIVRLRYFPGNAPPEAAFRAIPNHGPLPLAVTFDASATRDRNNDPLTYSWDLNGDTVFGDATAPVVSRTYNSPVNVGVTLRVTDPSGATDVAEAVVYPGDIHAPKPVIEAPVVGSEFSPGDQIEVRGFATDPDDPLADEDGRLPGLALHWSIRVEHCPAICHTHHLYEFEGTESGFTAPVHEAPSRLRVTLTATDSRGLRVSEVARFSFGADGEPPVEPPVDPPVEPPVDPQPRTVRLTVVSRPRGAGLRLGLLRGRSRLSGRFATGRRVHIAAARRMRRGGRLYAFRGWSDGRRRFRSVWVAEPRRRIALYRAVRRAERG